MSSLEGAAHSGALALEELAVDSALQIDRAPRYPIHAPVFCRVTGEPDWHEGVTVNISRTGIFFRIDSGLPPSARIEIRVVLSGEVAGESLASVLCMGTVLRRDFSDLSDGRIGIAASISHYRFRQVGDNHLPTRWRSVIP